MSFFNYCFEVYGKEYISWHFDGILLVMKRQGRFCMMYKQVARVIFILFGFVDENLKFSLW